MLNFGGGEPARIGVVSGQERAGEFLPVFGQRLRHITPPADHSVT